MRNILVDVYDARSFDVPKNDQSLFSGDVSYFSFGPSILSYSSYGSAARINFREADYLRLQICLSGSGHTSIGSAAADIDQTVLTCSSADAVYEFGRSFEQIVLRTGQNEIERDLASLLGARPKCKISFDLAVNSDAGQTRRLRELILYTASSIDMSIEPIPPPLLREMDQSIRLAILYGIPNNFTSLLAATPKASAPWQVRLVEEWIDAHWRESVSIEKLVNISGVSLRSIFSTFKSSRGYTPMAYLKQVRLNAAREMLLKAEPGASVTAIGFACNFQNSSHFAHDYERRFGELPSETLRRARGETH